MKAISLADLQKLEKKYKIQHFQRRVYDIYFYLQVTNLSPLVLDARGYTI